jgi:hypothetical protein
LILSWLRAALILSWLRDRVEWRSRSDDRLLVSSFTHFETNF